MNYYNEWDKGAAAWLRELINAGHIPPGIVDERSITEVKKEDLAGFTQCHFFCGIGGWPHALQLAGIPATVPLWTGSPPCQPFSVAGKQLGKDDPRHLAPAFLELIAQCRPAVLFGEQVAAAIGKHWLDALLIELEEQGYTCGAAVLPAASVGAPHKRDRLFFGASMGNAAHFSQHRSGDAGPGRGNEYSDDGSTGRMADTDDTRPQGRCGMPERADQQPAGAAGVAGSMADASGERRQQKPGSTLAYEAQNGREGWNWGESDRDNVAAGDVEIHPANPDNGFWSDADWLGCRDGKFRPVRSGSFPLANGLPARVGRLRGYGNAIVPQAAAEFIKAFEKALTDIG